MPPTGTWPPEGDSMLLSGYSDAEIARATGAACTTVAYHRRLLGLDPARHPGSQPQRGATARSRSIRLTDEEIEAFEDAADGRGWREWLRDAGRKLAGLT